MAVADAAPAGTLTELLKTVAAAFPSHLAVSVPGKYELTHGELDGFVDRVAAYLASCFGVGPGYVVALSCRDSMVLVVMFLAVLRARGVAASLNPEYRVLEMEMYLYESQPRLLITDAEGNPAAHAAAAKLGIRQVRVGAYIDRADFLARNKEEASRAKLLQLDTSSSHRPKEGNERNSLEPALKVLAVIPPCGEWAYTEYESDSQWRRLVAAAAAKLSLRHSGVPDNLAVLLQTAGTTGGPKWVQLTQGNLDASVRGMRDVYRMSETDVTVAVLPLFHDHGLLCSLLASLASGAAVALPAAGRRFFSASTFWADMRRAGATWYTAVPAIHQIILDRHASRPEQEGYPKLRFVRSCGAPLAPATLEKLEAAFGTTVLEAYTMTEASHLITSNLFGARKPGTVGRPLAQDQMALFDEAGRQAPAGEPGEVCIRGRNLTPGYKNNPEANKAAFCSSCGWFRTGDIGVIDDEGYLHIVGRKGELINRGGEKISPTEVDAVLLAHPAVKQAVSFAVPDVDKYGQEINCAVIPDVYAAPTEEEVLEHCRRNLPPFKVPNKVYITYKLPETPTRNIRRHIVARRRFVQPPKLATKWYIFVASLAVTVMWSR